MDKKKLLLATLLASTLVGSAAYADRATGGGIVGTDVASPIENKTFSDGSISANGGALLVNSGVSAVINNVVFQNNLAKNGGAISNINGSFAIDNSKFIANSISGSNYGGAIHNSSSADSSISNSIFSGNYSAKNNSNPGGSGAAIYNASSTGKLTLTNNTFTGNGKIVDGDNFTVKTTRGGAIFNSTGTLNINGGSLAENAAKNGGAIFATAGSVGIEGATIIDNIATDGEGGAIYNNGADFTIKEVTISGNNAIKRDAPNYRPVDLHVVPDGTITAGKGGAIYNNASGKTTSIIGGEISSNISSDGGAIFNNAGTVDIDGTTFEGNIASNTGGAIRNSGTSSKPGILTIKDATFKENIAGSSGGAIYNEAGRSVTLSGTNTFSGNKVGSEGSYSKNDIYNAGTLNLNGTTNLDGGINGGGTINLGAGSLTNMLGEEVLGTSSIGAATINVTNGAKISFDWGDSINAATINAIDDAVLGVNRVYVDKSISISEDSQFNLFAEGKATADLNATELTAAYSGYKNGYEYTLAQDSTDKHIINMVKGDTADLTKAVDNTTNGVQTVDYVLDTGENYGSASASDENRTIGRNTEFTIEGNDKTITAVSGAKGMIVAGESSEGAGDAAVLTMNNVIMDGFNVDSNGAIENHGTLNLNNSTMGANNTVAVLNAAGATLNIKDSIINSTIVNRGTLVSDPSVYEAGVMNYKGATFTVNGDTFQNIDRTGENGGAIYNEAASGSDPAGVVTLNNVTVTGNQATSGGVLYNAGTAIINGGVFGGVDNSDPANPVSLGNSAQNGGAIYSNGLTSVTTIDNASFISNSANTSGGAIYANSGVVNIENGTTFTANKAGLSATTSTTTGGGAIYARQNAQLNIGDNVVFDGNTAGYSGDTVNANYRGGAIYLYSNTSHDPIFGTGVEFKNNKASDMGGAIYTNTTTLSNLNSGVTFTNNQANKGGALALGSGTIARVIGDTVFNGNKAVGENASGGAIYDSWLTQNKNTEENATNNITTLAINGATFSSNTSDGVGGAIGQPSVVGYNSTTGKYSKANSIIINNGTTFTENKAVNAGGAIYSDAVLNVTGATFTSNEVTGTSSATKGGGAIFADDDSNVTITNSTFGDSSDATKGNTATGNGGAIYNAGKLVITDSSFYNNKAGDEKLGGAIYSSGDVTINAINSAVTFSGNTADVGGDILMQGNSANQITLALNATDNTNKISFGEDIDGEYYNININTEVDSNNDPVYTGDVELSNVYITSSTQEGVTTGNIKIGAGNVTAKEVKATGLTVNSGASLQTTDALKVTNGSNAGTINGDGAMNIKGEYENTGLISKAITLDGTDAKLTTAGANTTSVTSATSGITNTVSNASGTLELTGGNVIANVSGNGTTVINSTATVTNAAQIENYIKISSGTLSTDASNVATGDNATIANKGTLELTGGTLSKGVTGLESSTNGIVDINATSGDEKVTLASGGSITDNVIKLTAGTFDVTAKNVHDDTSDTDTIDLSSTTKILAGGGVLDVSGDSKTSTVKLGNIDTSNSALKVAIDADLADAKADVLSMGTEAGSNKIQINKFNITSDPSQTTFEFQIADDSAKEHIDLTTATIAHEHGLTEGAGNLLLTYDSSRGYLTGTHTDLTNAITSTIGQKVYEMSDNESINGPLQMGGSSLSITGNNKTISSVNSANDGIQVPVTGSLGITDGSISGFKTAIDNTAGGTVNLTNAIMTDNTTDIINDGEIDVTDPSNPVNHGVFLTGTNSINTIKDSTSDASKGQTTISSGTSTIGSLIQKSVTVESPATLNIAADKLVTTSGTDNQGILNLSAGNLASNINDTQDTKTGVTNILGAVTNTNDKTIAQKSVTVSGTASLTTKADKVAANEGIDNAGILNLSGSSGTDTPTALASVVKNATGTTNITGNVSTDKNITQNNVNVGTLDTSTDPATETTGSLINNAVVNATNIRTTANSSITSNASDLVASAGIDNAGTLNLTGDIDDTAVPAVETGKLASNISNTNGTTNVLGNISTNGKTINQATVNVGNDTITATLDNLTNPSTITTGGDINIASTGTVSSAANNLIANGANGIANNGILNLNGGALASNITGSNGVTSIAGDVTSDKDITQDTIFVGSSGADTSGYYPSPITADGSFTNTGNIDTDYIYVTTNGILNQNGGTLGTSANPTYIDSDGVLNITDGTVTAESISTWDDGVTTISGGTVNVDYDIYTTSDATTNITGGTVVADTIDTVANGTTNLNGGNITAIDSINNTGNGTTNISTLVTTPEVNAESGIVNLNSGSDTSSSTKLGNADINIEDGIVNVNTTADKYSVNNSVNGVNNGDGSLDLNGKSGTPRTASTANETIFTIDAAVNNANITLASGQLNLLNENNMTNSTLNVANGATLNTMDGSGTTYNSNINFADGSQVKTDVDVFSQTSDRFANASEAGSEVLTDVNLANLDKIVRNNTNINLKDITNLRGLVVSDELQNRKFQAMTPIRIMEATLGADGMMNIHPSSGRNDWRSFNPSILASPVAAQLGGYLNQLNSYDEAFRNMDMYMLMTKSQRQALKLRNKYAAATTTDFVTYDPNQTMYEKSAGWFRPYATFEKVNLKNGPKVSNVAYGSFFGGESELKDLGHGWDGMWGAYVGYNGSHQAYNGISIYQNGGTLGAVGMAYKGNFFTGLTINAGANAGEASTYYGNDNFAMLMAGIASKSGYNWELAHGKFIIQPSYMMSYSFVNTFDYTNAAGVRMNSDPLHAIQIEPGVKFIGNLKNGWQPYIGVSMVWNIMDKSDVHANDIALPELSVKPFVKYGIGIRKTWGERFTGFFQTYFTNGGRNGVGLQAGFRWTIGKEGNSSSSADSGAKKAVLKEMTPQQKMAAMGQKKVIKQSSIASK